MLVLRIKYLTVPYVLALSLNILLYVQVPEVLVLMKVLSGPRIGYVIALKLV